MRHLFDQYGWYAGEGDGERSTDLEPANKSVSQDIGAPRSNFTGVVWIETPYFETTPAVPTVTDYTAAIQVMLDAKVLERRYYNILSACTYATSTNATFNAEGQACVSWRDAVWAKAYDVLAQVEAKTLEQPTVLQLLSMLPTMEWPNV